MLSLGILIVLENCVLIVSSASESPGAQQMSTMSRKFHPKKEVAQQHSGNTLNRDREFGQEL